MRIGKQYILNHFSHQGIHICNSWKYNIPYLFSGKKTKDHFLESLSIFHPVFFFKNEFLLPAGSQSHFVVDTFSVCLLFVHFSTALESIYPFFFLDHLLGASLPVTKLLRNPQQKDSMAECGSSFLFLSLINPYPWHQLIFLTSTFGMHLGP